MKINRRSFIALAGVSALGAAGLRSAAAQMTSPYVMSNGSTVTWSDPWHATWAGPEGLIDDAVILANDQDQIAIGYLSAPMTIDEWIAWSLEGFGLDETTAPPDFGGAIEYSDANGVKVADVEYQIHTITDTPLMLYFQLTNGVDFTILRAPSAELAATVASIQETVARDGMPVLEGEEIQAYLEDEATGQRVIGGEFTDVTGKLHVTWIEGWTVVEQAESYIALANPERSVVFATQVLEFTEQSWDQEVAWIFNNMVGDQGPAATSIPPVVTETGFSFSTDGDYGLRLAQGTATEHELDHFILSFASNMTVNGAEALAILQQIQADVTVNGQPPLQGLDAFIDMSAT